MPGMRLTNFVVPPLCVLHLCSYVICDEKLKGLFKVNKFQGFSMQKYLGPHLEKSG